MSQNSFDQKKKSILDQINSTDEDNPDASPKGTLDIPLLPLINLINSHSDYVTTSSCSGRVSVFLEGLKTSTELGGKGDGGKWLFITHDVEELKDTDWWSTVKNYSEDLSTSNHSQYDGQRYVLYKFEAMILHVKCRDRASASALYTAAMGCGFRESGIGSNDLVGIRISLRLDVPLGYVSNGKIITLVPDSYVKHLESISVDLFEKNLGKINQLFRTIEKMVNQPKSHKEIKETKEERRQRKIQEGLRLQALKKSESKEDAPGLEN